jgi:hypothetical protein
MRPRPAGRGNTGARPALYAEFFASMRPRPEHGVLAFTLNLQGGSPEGYSIPKTSRERTAPSIPMAV